MAACDNTLVHACLRMPKDISVSMSSAVYTRATERHEVSAHHCVLWWCHASELRLRSAFIPDVLFPNKSVRHPLMITTHHRHSVSPSWSTLFSPPIPLEDYSRVPPASPCMVIKHEPYWQGEHQTLFFLGLFTRRQKEEKNRITKLLYPRVKSICLFE